MLQTLVVNKNIMKTLDLISREIGGTFIAVAGIYNGFSTEKNIVMCNNLTDLVSWMTDKSVLYLDEGNLVLQTVRMVGEVTVVRDFYIYKLNSRYTAEDFWAERFNAKEVKKYLENFSDLCVEFLYV